MFKLYKVITIICMIIMFGIVFYPYINSILSKTTPKIMYSKSMSSAEIPRRKVGIAITKSPCEEALDAYKESLSDSMNTIVELNKKVIEEKNSNKLATLATAISATGGLLSLYVGLKKEINHMKKKSKDKEDEN